MNPEITESRPLGEEGEALFDLLTSAVAAGEAFELFFVCSASEPVLDEVQRRLETASDSNNCLQKLTYGTPGDLQNLLPDLLNLPGADAGRQVICIRGRGARDELAAAWTRALVVLNEQRNRIIGHLPGALLLLGPEQLSSIAQRRAPDLWSIRSSVFVLPNPPLKTDSALSAMDYRSGREISDAGTQKRGEYYAELARALAGSRGKPEQISRANLLLRAAEAWCLSGQYDKAMEAAFEVERIAREDVQDETLRARAIQRQGLCRWVRAR